MATETIVVHGTSCQLEDNEALGPGGSVDRRGWGTILRGLAPLDANPTWVHFSIPTPLHPESRRLEAAFICFRETGGVEIRSIHLWDGATRIFTVDDKHLGGSFEKPSFRLGSLGGVELRPARSLVNGLGISIGIWFPVGRSEQERVPQQPLPEITLISAGARFRDGLALWGHLQRRR